MALQGNLRDFSVTEILQLLGTQKKTGCLLLEWNTERARLFVLDGRIVSSREPGMRADDPFLSFLVKAHRLSDEQRRGILSIQRESGRDLEDLLENGRYLEADEMSNYLERQLLDDLMQLVRWENGTYRFDPNSRWPNPPRVRLSMEGALIEAARRVDEEKRYVARFRDPYELLGVRDLPDPDEPLSEEEKEIFGLIDGQHTVAEVVEAAPLSEYEAYEALHRMLEANWLEPGGRRDPGREAPTLLPHVEIQTPARFELGRELAFAGAVIALFFAFQWSSRFVPQSPNPHPSTDVFVQQGMRQVRDVLELYHRESGRYPDNLDVLADDRYLDPSVYQGATRPLRYHRLPNDAGYVLEVAKR
ncbi:MAG: DUF4388 domain-containing protein [Candidatus Eisenbacteria bacterium]|uniref:DUF4388 domain-containing protein n=1 Tax=Eiseniibacteriota bacterium TaxID=2212470 RepID=A0A849SQW1_UNCEI|nr:DUF4388 domain-containing protein [Candidatus Eisenbacteria bacterium]